MGSIEKSHCKRLTKILKRLAMYFFLYIWEKSEGGQALNFVFLTAFSITKNLPMLYIDNKLGLPKSNSSLFPISKWPWFNIYSLRSPPNFTSYQNKPLQFSLLSSFSFFNKTNSLPNIFFFFQWKFLFSLENTFPIETVPIFFSNCRHSNVLSKIVCFQEMWPLLGIQRITYWRGLHLNLLTDQLPNCLRWWTLLKHDVLFWSCCSSSCHWVTLMNSYQD